MCGGLVGVSEGIAAMSTANADTELTTGLSVLDLIEIYLPLQRAFSDLLSNLAEKVYKANLNVPGNPSGTVDVAKATEDRNIASTQSDTQTGNLDTIIQGEKAQAQLLGNAMTATFSLQTPLNELLRFDVSAIQKM